MDNLNGTALKSIVCSLSVGFQIIKITSKSIQSNYIRVHCHIHSPPLKLGQKKKMMVMMMMMIDNDADDDDNGGGGGGGGDYDDNEEEEEEEEDLCLSIP